MRDRQLAAPGESETLQSLVINELKTKKHTASEGLLWLVRLGPTKLALYSTPKHERFPNNILQRPRLHVAGHPQQSPKPLPRALRLVPHRLRQHPETTSLLHGEADFQRGHVGNAVPERLLRQAGRRLGKSGPGGGEVVGGVGTAGVDTQAVPGEEGGQMVACLWTGAVFMAWC